MTGTAVTEETGVERAPAGVGPYGLAARRLRRNWVAQAFGALFILMVALCLLAPVYAKHVAKTGPNVNVPSREDLPRAASRTRRVFQTTIMKAKRWGQVSQIADGWPRSDHARSVNVVAPRLVVKLHLFTELRYPRNARAAYARAQLLTV